MPLTGSRAARAILPALLLFSAACAGPSSSSKATLNKLIAGQQFEEARDYVDKVKESQYGRKNAVLYYLDRGLLLHHQGRYKESDKNLDMAENRMKELYTKSATKASAMLLLNDNTMDYSGEPFERALTNVFRALNYVFLGDTEEALVEARKVELYLDELNRMSGGKRSYKNDVLARYLDSLLYADMGKEDDSRISFNSAKAAAGPLKLEPPSLDMKNGEIVFLHFNGTAPRKFSKTFQIAWGHGLAAVNAAKEEGDPEAHNPQFQNALRAAVADKQITVAFPEYKQDPYSIVSSEIQVGETSVETVLVEDITAIAMKDLQDRIAFIRTRAIARAMIKFVLSKAATAEMEKKYGKNSGAAWLTKIGTNIASAATEIADTRGWSTLPSQIRMARIKVAPGVYTLTATFKDGAGRTVSSLQFKNIVVKLGKRTYLGYRTAL